MDEFLYAKLLSVFVDDLIFEECIDVSSLFYSIIFNLNKKANVHLTCALTDDVGNKDKWIFSR